MLQWDEPEFTDGVRHRPATAFFESLRVPYSASRACLSRWVDHRLAILVDQGSDPMVPYQALVIRESAMLFLGFTPWGREAFSAREPGAARVYSPDSVDCIAPTPRRANTIGRMSPISWGPRRRPSWIRCSSSWSGLASVAYSR